MSISSILAAFDAAAVGTELHQWVADWYPIPRSLSGNGIREQFRRMQAHIPLRVTEVPTGTQVFDWTVPREWNVREAWIKDFAGRKIVDFAESNLHLMGYSVPVHARMPLPELREHVLTLPEQPDLTPYRTSYYSEQWAFAMPHRLLESLPDGEYEVHIDATLDPGHLSYAECVIPGESEEEIFFSAHACHPSLANDNLSGLAIATWLARALAGLPLHHTCRFVFAPGTIGAITWLEQHETEAARIRHGLILSLLGDPAAKTYKKSRRGDAKVDIAMEHVLYTGGQPYSVIPFIPYGYDERQYCSPGFNLPVGCLMRSEPAKFPEYHTSADNLAFVRPESLADSLRTVLQVLEILEGDRFYVNLNPKCEPQLGKRGLYSGFFSGPEKKAFDLALLWVLNGSDGAQSLLDIARRAGLSFTLIKRAADALLEVGLLKDLGREKPA